MKLKLIIFETPDQSAKSLALPKPIQIIPSPAVHTPPFPKSKFKNQKSKMYTALSRVCTRLCHDLNAQKPLILLVCHDVTTWSTPGGGGGGRSRLASTSRLESRLTDG